MFGHVWTILLLSEVAMRIMRVNVVAPREDISKHVPTIYTAFKKFIKHFPVNWYCMLYIFKKKLIRINA